MFFEVELFLCHEITRVTLDFQKQLDKRNTQIKKKYLY